VDPIVLVAIGLVVAVAIAALAFGRARSGSTRRSDQTSLPALGSATSGPTVIQPSRIVVVGERHPGDAAVVVAAGRPAPAIDPRQRLLRDAAAVLLVGSLGVVVLVNLPAVGGSSGGVLSVTATPAAGPGQPAPVRTAGPSAAASAPGAPASAEVGGSGSSTGGGTSAAPMLATPVATIPGGSLALLEPCPDRTDCYMYVVRRGDTLSQLSRRFGILTETILRLNPTIADPSLIVTGDRLIVPTPTR
jgi:nucleoid-associated protein YgaU